MSYKPCFELANESLETVVERIQVVREQPKQETQIVDAILGSVQPPMVTLEDVEKIFFENLAPPLIKSKSPTQKKRWTQERQHTFSLLRDVIGNKDIVEINRDDALKFYNFLMEKVAPTEGEPTRSASFGRRQLTQAKNFYREYFRYIGDRAKCAPIGSPFCSNYLFFRNFFPKTVSHFSEVALVKEAIHLMALVLRKRIIIHGRLSVCNGFGKKS